MPLLSRPRVTLSLEPDELRVLVIERGQQVTTWGRVRLSPGTMQGDVIRNPLAVAQALHTLWQVHRIPSNRVVVSIPASQTSVRLVAVQPDQPVDRETALNLAARFWPLESSSVAWQVLEYVGRPMLFLLRVPQEVVDQIHALFSEVGLRIVGLEPKPLALLRAIGREQAIIVDVEPSLATVVIAGEGIPFHVAGYPLDAPLLSTAMSKAVRVVEFLNSALGRYNVSGPGAPIDITVPLFCTGALGDFPFLHRLVREVLGQTIERLTVPVPVPADLPVHRYMANVGLALKRRLW